MTSQQLERIAHRGLTLPEPTLTRLRTVGIWCEANLTMQRREQDWLIRGQESGDAVSDIGRYVSFCKEDGSALNWLQPVKHFMPNGLHAVLLQNGQLNNFGMPFLGYRPSIPSARPRWLLRRTLPSKPLKTWASRRF